MKKLISLVSILSFFMLTLAACSTPHHLGGDRFAVTRLSEERSSFGTNAGWTKLEDCKRVANEAAVSDPTQDAYKFEDCKDITEWKPVSSPGQGGTILAGLLNFVGFFTLGLLSFMKSGDTIVQQSQSQTQTQSVVNTVGKSNGHHK